MLGPVKGRGNKYAKILILGEAPGEQEIDNGIPFYPEAPSGEMLFRSYLGKNDLNLKDVYLDNVTQYLGHRPFYRGGRKIKWNPSTDDIVNSLVGLRQRIRELPNVNVIAAVGNTALRALTVFQKSGITTYRGSILRSPLTGHKIVPLVHPAWVLQGGLDAYRYLHVSIADMERVMNESNTASLNLPNRDHRIHYDLDSAVSVIREYISRRRWAFDVETTLACVGFSSDSLRSDTIPFDSVIHEDLSKNGRRRRILCEEFKKLFTHDHQIITQNGPFDMEVMWRDYGIEPTDWHIHSDTMFKHQLLYSELPHSLAFLTSLYTREPFYKDEGRGYRRGVDPEKRLFIYNGKDCCVTLESDNKMENELAECGQKEYFYNNIMPLLPVLFSMYRKGVRVNQVKLDALKNKLWREETIERIRQLDDTHRDPNARSALDMEEFFQHIGIKDSDLLRTKTGKVKINEDNLSRLAAKYNSDPIRRILRLKKLLTLQSNFTNIPKFIPPRHIRP